MSLCESLHSGKLHWAEHPGVHLALDLEYLRYYFPVSRQHAYAPAGHVVRLA